MHPIRRASPFTIALVLAVGATGACSSSSTNNTDAAANTDAPAADVNHNADGTGSITLTSTAFSEGGTFPAANTCAGINTSPPITWSAGPSGTLSYAVSLTDLNNAAVHWVIWDIPAATTTLPAALPGDTTLTTPVSAMQIHKVEFFGAGGAYRGPCPNGANHTYQFDVFAIGTATLAGVPATPTSEGVKATAQAAALAHGSLSGMSSAMAPPADASGQ